MTPPDIPLMRPFFSPTTERRVAKVLESGWVTQGPVVGEFERAFADYVGADHAIATNSCTSALHLILRALDIGDGDEVIVPSLSFIATANAVVHAGAVPAFADVLLDSGNLDPDSVEAAVTSRTRAVIAVHQLGLPAEIARLSDVCRKHGLRLIEDAACAVGSSIDGRMVGGGPAPAAFSFHPRKLITTGEGGMLTTDDEDLARRVRRLRNQGMSLSDLDRHRSSTVVFETYEEVGFNYRMTDIQAAVGLAQMEILGELLSRRRAQALRYSAAFGPVAEIAVPPDDATHQHNFQSYMIRIDAGAQMTRDQLMQALLRDGIASRRGVMATHLEPSYGNASPLPVTEEIAETGLLLPLFHELSEVDQDRVIESVVRYLGADH